MEVEAPFRNLVADELFNERVRTFREFLDNDYGENEYRDKIMKMLLQKEKRLLVNIKHIRTFNQEYAQGLLDDPVDFLPAFEKALRDVVFSLGEGENNELYSIGIEGSFGENHVSAGTLSSSHLGKMISIEGIVSRCSLVYPKVVRSVHYCEATQMFHSKEYRDQTHLGNALPTGSVYPKEDENGNPLTTEFGLSIYRGSQTITIQEMPERAPAGQLPRPIDVVLVHDLTDRTKPGDRIRIVGVYQSLGKHAASTSATFKTLLLANNIKQLGKSAEKLVISESEISMIKNTSKRKDIFEALSRSLAPSIYGHEFIKKAVLLQLLGGVEKNLENGTHIRGDINILMIGDPSTAKSQMLRFVLNTAPLAIATTGRGSSGVGLTAAVTTDKDTGERRLEAGAMVLADRGIVCIDEFDKMNDIDRVAIHEVMEQQTVTIAKAGIHTSLNARCSVIAAANPVMGQYVDTKEPSKNINLPDSLLSRFDLLFVVLDNLEDEHNRAIAEHVVRLHRYVPPGLDEGAPIDENYHQNSFMISATADEEAGELKGIYERYNQLLHKGMKSLGLKTSRRRKKKNSIVPDDCIDLFTIPFIRKYIEYAKKHVKPVLTDEASDLISRQYSELRAWEDGRDRKYRVMPITARTLETLIRLSTAHAKARLSALVEESDVEVAVELLEYALYKEVKKKNKRVKLEEDESEAESEEDEQVERVTDRPMDLDEAPQMQLDSAGFEVSQTSAALSALIDSQIGSSLSGSRQERFEGMLHEFRRRYMLEHPDSSEEEVPASLFWDAVRNTFNREEFNQYLTKMTDDNRIWYRESADVIFFM